jgi:hypothetical protein
MDLWTCQSCGSKNAAVACWKCGANRPGTAAPPAAPSTPAVPSAPAAGPSTPATSGAAGAWDPAGAVPSKPPAPSWSEPITVWTAPASDWQAAAPAGSTPAPPLPAYAYSPPAAASTSAAWSAPATGAPAPPPSGPASPPPAPSPSASRPLPAARILVVAGVVLVVLVLVLVLVLRGRAAALSTPASVEGLPQIQGATVDALAQQARRNSGADGEGMLVGVYGRDQVPAFIFVVVQSRGNGLGTFEKGFIRGASQVGFNPGDFQHRSRNGVRYDCGIVQIAAGVPLSFCFFDDGSATGAGLVPDDQGIDRALQLTSSGRGAAESG